MEGPGARAYTTHQHGLDLTHGLQLVVEGRKKVMWWPYEEREKLYPLGPGLTTEGLDEVFMADPWAPRHRFPSLDIAEAWEAELGPGDLLYVPPVGIHLFESVGISFGVRFRYFDDLLFAANEELKNLWSPVDRSKWTRAFGKFANQTRSAEQRRRANSQDFAEEIERPRTMDQLIGDEGCKAVSFSLLGESRAIIARS